jgi:hypothetical protein
MNTLNMRIGIRKQHHLNYPVNLTEIVDRDLKKIDESVEVSQSNASVRRPSKFELDENGWFVGNVLGP